MTGEAAQMATCGLCPFCDSTLLNPQMLMLSESGVTLMGDLILCPECDG